MKAIRLEAPKAFRRIEVAEPPPPGQGQALVRVRRVGICGTDISGYLGKMPFFSYPRVPGHELGVEVLAIGEGVQNIKAGDVCSVEPYMNCGHCSACRRGRINCCENLRVLGVMMDGGMTERLLLPARKVHRANELSAEQCALVETLAIGCHAVNRADPKPGQAVLIIGAGPIGLTVSEFTRLAGARAIMMDLSEARLSFVRDKMNNRDTVRSSGDGSEIDRVRDVLSGELPQIVIDATGSHASMSRALEYCAFGGRLVFVGITQAQVSFPHAPVMHRRELEILASRNALPADFTRIIRLIEEGKIDTRPWISHRADFGEMIDAFPGWTNPEAGVIKAMVTMS